MILFWISYRTFLIPKTSKNTKSTKTCSYWWQSSMIALLQAKVDFVLKYLWEFTLSSSNRFATRHSSNEFDSALTALRFQDTSKEKQLIICNNLPIYFCNLFVFSGFFGIQILFRKNAKIPKYAKTLFLLMINLWSALL